MSLSPGQRLGGYEITSLLGAGGMGEVYRARDTRLNRDVALKILPARTANDPHAFARFEREAQAVAALSHPNILAVHDFGRSDGASYVVFELLEGETLRARLAQGPLPVRKAIDFARQVADGLAAAHARDITHRDIKPDNLFVTDDGRVKILDFGLAQTTARGVDADAQTLTQAPITEAGTVLGTVGYMAPEQVRGQAVDHRADLFALGCVLYELCTGRRAFQGATPADTMTAILSSDPPELTLAGQSTPPALDRIVRRCLEKSAAERFQSARDLSFALDALSNLSGSVPDASRGASVPRRRRGTLVAAAVAAAFGAGAIAGHVLWPSAPAITSSSSALRIRAEFPSPMGNLISMTMALSPDGRRLAYSDVVPDTGRRHLMIRDLATGESVAVPNSEDGMSATWSHRSDALLFYAAPRELRRFRLGDKSTALVVPVPELFRGAAWLRDDTVVFATAGFEPVRRVPVGGGAVTTIVTTKTDVFGGPTTIGERSDHVLALQGLRGGAGSRRAVLIRLTDGHITDLLPSDAEPALSAGHLLLPRSAGLFAVPFDAGRLAVTGEPVFVGESVLWEAASGISSLTANSMGVIAFRPGRDRSLRFEWIDANGKSLGPIGPPALYGSFALSPDGTRVIVRQLSGFTESGVTASLLFIDLTRGVASPVSIPEGPVSDPIWTADGTRVLYRLGDSLRRQSPTASTPETLMQEGIFPDDLTADGRWLIAGTPNTAGGFGLFVMPVERPAERQPLSDGPFSSDEGSFSPNGRLLSYQSTKTGRPEIFLARFPLTDDRWQVSSGGGVQARWSSDGRTLYYLGLDGHLMRVAVPLGRPDHASRAERMFDLRIGVPSALLEQYAVHGDRFLVLRPPPDSAPQTIAVISNWTQGLAR
jgi:eukaryotic-like serine/threonine-protein kinase